RELQCELARRLHRHSHHERSQGCNRDGVRDGARNQLRGRQQRPQRGQALPSELHRRFRGERLRPGRRSSDPELGWLHFWHRQPRDLLANRRRTFGVSATVSGGWAAAWASSSATGPNRSGSCSWGICRPAAAGGSHGTIQIGTRWTSATPGATAARSPTAARALHSLELEEARWRETTNLKVGVRIARGAIPCFICGDGTVADLAANQIDVFQSESEHTGPIDAVAKSSSGYPRGVESRPVTSHGASCGHASRTLRDSLASWGGRN